MSEIIINIDNIDPLDLYGADNRIINEIKKYYTKLKIIERGDIIKVVGDKDSSEEFEKKLNRIISYINSYGDIDNKRIESLILSDNSVVINSGNKENVILYGKNGKLISARTPNQKKLVLYSNKYDLVFAIGPAGTGKTFTAVALAVKALKEKIVKKIVLTRPAVEAGENLGFLPGDYKEKLDPYLRPLYDALKVMLPNQKLPALLEEGTVEIAPLAFMRGRTLEDAFVILDEAQNASEGQLKMFLTRMGNNTKYIVTGDITQVDLPKKTPSGLIQVERLLKNIPGIKFIYFNEADVVRHKLVQKIIKAYDI